MKQIFLLIFVALFIFSCSNDKPAAIAGLLNEQNLTSQFFTIDTESDTILLTKNGCVIKIPKGSIAGSSQNIKLEIKEALSNTDIVMAGLTTMSGSQSLSSGGMIYFNAAEGYSITIKKQIEVLVPTKNYNRDMQVFKGDTVNGKIDWKGPEALPHDSTTIKVDAGKALFISNCSSCHKPNDDFTGPALNGIIERYPWEWVYALTLHDYYFFETGLAGEYQYADTSLAISKDSSRLKFLQSLSRNELTKISMHHKCVHRKYGSEMTSFILAEEDVKNIYSYIKSESTKAPRSVNILNFKDCCDSCVDYIQASLGLVNQREKLKEDNGQFFNLDRVITVPPMDTTMDEVDPTATAFPDPPYNKVSSTQIKATYYTINIKTVGWYNIDILMKGYNGCVESELFVRLQGSYELDVNINLIIPQYKVFVEGGKLTDGKQYGFDEKDGKIMLPQNTKAYIIAFAEKDDKLIFAKKEFNTQIKQTIELAFIEISKQQLKAEIASLKLDNVETEVKDSKNAGEIRTIDKKIQAAENIKPKNCNCDFLQSQPAIGDTVKNK